MPAYDSTRPSFVPVAPAASTETLTARLTYLVEHNQLAAMAGAFAVGVLLGVIARR